MKLNHPKVALAGIFFLVAGVIGILIAGGPLLDKAISRLGGASDTRANPKRPAIAAGLNRLPVSGARILSVSRPLSFEPNRGQSAVQVRYLARTPGYSVFITEHEVVMALNPAPRAAPAVERKPGFRLFGDQRTQTGSVWIKLLGASDSPKIEAANPMRGRVSYFVDNDPARWHRDIPTYARVIEHGVWQGIDLAWHGNQKRLEGDFVVAPRAEPGAIDLGFEGQSALFVDAQGNLVITAGGREMKLLKPGVYQAASYPQETGYARHVIDGRYVVTGGPGGERRVRFAIAPYDRTRTLVVDPTVELDYSTYLGGSGNDWVGGIAVDSKGAAYVTGTAHSSDFPLTPGSYQPPSPLGSPLAFLTKFNSDGSAFEYSTWIGGGGNFGIGANSGAAVAVDSNGDAFITGLTNSPKFPQTNPSLSTGCGAQAGGGKVFVTEFNPEGSDLVYSACFGGNSMTELYTEVSQPLGIALDSQGDAFIAGWTNSPTFTTVNAYQSVIGAPAPITPTATPSAAATATPQCPTDTYFDPTIEKCVGPFFGNAFVTEISPGASEILYSTYLGGTGNPKSLAIESDRAHQIETEPSVEADAAEEIAFTMATFM